MKNIWDQRYQRDEYVYGTSPNAFLESAAGYIPKGRVLCLAEGEGRNAVFLAGRGYDVFAVDASAVGLQKAGRLAAAKGVSIHVEVKDLADYEIRPESWQAVVSIFGHLPPVLRKAVHRSVVAGLCPGGVFILEAYTPAQLKYGTGGPPSAEMMMTLAELGDELAGLKFEHALETERDIREGTQHKGRGAVVQVVAVKPFREGTS